MDQQSKAKLEAKGWQMGTATDFLNLTPEDLLIIEIRLALTRRLEERQQDDTSGAIAPTRQNTDSLTSLDQLIHDMLSTGASPQEIGKIIASVDMAAVA